MFYSLSARKRESLWWHRISKANRNTSQCHEGELNLSEMWIFPSSYDQIKCKRSKNLTRRHVLSFSFGDISYRQNWNQIFMFWERCWKYQKSIKLKLLKGLSVDTSKWRYCTNFEVLSQTVLLHKLYGNDGSRWWQAISQRKQCVYVLEIQYFNVALFYCWSPSLLQSFKTFTFNASFE